MGDVMRILVLWADNYSANLGVRVLAEGAASLSVRAFGESAEVVFQDFAGRESGLAITPRALSSGLLSRRSELARFVGSFDLVMDTGAGDSFADIYGARRLVALFGMQKLATRVGVPLVLAPQTIGPFDTRIGRMGAKHTLRSRATLSFARDSVSYAYAQALGARNIHVGTDLVFALPRQEPEQVSGNDVLLNVSGLLWNGSAHVDRDKYRAVVRSVIDMLLSVGRRVDIFPHVLDSEFADNDVPISARLADEYDGRLGIIQPEDLNHARREIASSRLVVASRMHAVLNAVSQGVPAIPLAYSRKFQPLFADMGVGGSIDLRADEVENITLHIARRLLSFDRGEHLDDYREAEMSTRLLLDGVVATLRETIVGTRHA